MRKILLGTTAVVGLALVAQAANAQQARPAARPAPAPVAAPAAPPPLPATSVAPTGTAAAIYQTPVGITGAGSHGSDGVPNRPETPTTSGLVVRLGGFFDFSMGNVSDDADSARFRNTAAGSATNTNVTFTPTGGTATNGVLTTPGAAAVTSARGRQRNDFRTESEINLYVDGVAANGMRYGALFELQMDAMTTTAGTGTGVDYDELYGFVKGSWGELRFGQEDSAASLLQIRRPGTLWMGDSDAWDEFVANSGYIIAGVGDGNDASKVIYLSPQFMGFDAGISYAPNRFEGEQANIPTSVSNFQRDRTGLENEVSLALRYRGTFGPVGASASFVAQFADAASQSANGTPIADKAQNITTYAAGLLLRAYGFAVGGDYTWGNYRTTPANGAIAQGIDGSSQWATGITYTIGALTIGGMYSQGTQDNGGTVADRTQTYMGLGAAYVLAPGMTLFANYNQISDENIPNLGTATSPTKTGAKVFEFGTNDKTRDITVLVAGVRVAF
jgi:predicted porin